MRTTSTDPAQVCIVLPAQWIAGLDHATELVRQQNPRMPDGERLQVVLVAGILATIHAFDSKQPENGKSFETNETPIADVRP